jgi:glutathione S-transferase
VRFPNPEARKRFVDESIRVLGVLDGELQDTDGEKKEWLVGGKCTAADLVFVPYMWSMDFILGDSKPNLAKDFPNVEAWMQRMSARASVKKVKRARDAALAAQARPQASK